MVNYIFIIQRIQKKQWHCFNSIVMHRDVRDQKIKLYRDQDRDRDQIKRVTGTWTGTGTKKSWSRTYLVMQLVH